VYTLWLVRPIESSFNFFVIMPYIYIRRKQDFNINFLCSYRANIRLLYCCREENFSRIVWLDTSVMSVGIPLYRLFAISRLTSAQSCLSTASLQLQRRVCLTSYYSSKNCHTGPENINSIMWSRRAVLKPEASWQKLTYNCGFHTTPQRYIPPILWLVIKPLAKVASALSGR